MADPSKYRSSQEIDNANQDLSVDPFVAVRGVMVKRSGTWSYWDGNNSGDAGLFRVSAIGVATGSTVATNQVSITSGTATQIIGVNTSRIEGVLIVNHSTQDIYLGSSAVVSASTGNGTPGLLLLGAKGASVTLPTTSAIYGIVSATGQTISYFEI